MGSLSKVTILDTIGFDLARRDGAVQVRFAKCLVHDDGTVERQWSNDKLLCHRVTIARSEDIDARMAMESQQIRAMGYDPPTPRMIARVKAHCALEWDGEFTEQHLLAAPPMEFVQSFDGTYGGTNDAILAETIARFTD
jgi:hypothetical protein